MRKTVVVLALLVLFTASAAFAGSASSNMTVSATINSQCTIAVTQNLDFGTINAITTASPKNEATAGVLSYQCSPGSTAPYVGIDLGGNASGGQRYVKSGANTLAYNLFQDSSHSTAWGNTAGTNTWTVPGANLDGNAHTQSVYGQLVFTTAAPAGAYSDTVAVQINF